MTVRLPGCETVTATVFVKSCATCSICNCFAFCVLHTNTPPHDTYDHISVCMCIKYRKDIKVLMSLHSLQLNLSLKNGYSRQIRVVKVMIISMMIATFQCHDISFIVTINQNHWYNCEVCILQPCRVRNEGRSSICNLVQLTRFWQKLPNKAAEIKYAVCEYLSKQEGKMQQVSVVKELFVSQLLPWFDCGNLDIRFSNTIL